MLFKALALLMFTCVKQSFLVISFQPSPWISFQRFSPSNQIRTSANPPATVSELDIRSIPRQKVAVDQSRGISLSTSSSNRSKGDVVPILLGGILENAMDQRFKKWTQNEIDSKDNDDNDSDDGWSSGGKVIEKTSDKSETLNETKNFINLDITQLKDHNIFGRNYVGYEVSRIQNSTSIEDITPIHVEENADSVIQVANNDKDNDKVHEDKRDDKIVDQSDTSIEDKTLIHVEENVDSMAMIVIIIVTYIAIVISIIIVAMWCGRQKKNQVEHQNVDVHVEPYFLPYYAPYQLANLEVVQLV